MERLNLNLIRGLARRAEVRVIGPVPSRDALAGIPYRQVALRPLPRFLASVQWAALHVSLAWKPDLVFAGSGLTALSAAVAARSCGAYAAVYTHGLDLAVAHPVYRGLWAPAIRSMDRVIVNSTATGVLAARMGVEARRIELVHPGVELRPIVSLERVRRFRAELGVGSRPLIISVGRLTERKGLAQFIEKSLPEIVRRAPECVLLVAGDAPAEALYAKPQSIEEIRAAANRAGVADHVRFLGVLTCQNRLDELYASAALHIFPVRELSSDPEGFGMVAIEAAAHGTPTVAFATGGVVDAVLDGYSGVLVPPGDYVGLSEAVASILMHGMPRDQSRQFAERFAWDRFDERIADAISL